MKFFAASLLLLQLWSEDTAEAFTTSLTRPLARSFVGTTQLQAKKQTRSTLIKPKFDKAIKPKVKEEEVFGAKFFGGNAIKEELFDEAAEERATKLSKLYPPKDLEDEEDTSIYNRFMDSEAFDNESRILAQRVQTAINQALYEDDSDASSTSLKVSDLYSPTLQWNTPLSKSKTSKNPLEELTNSIEFYRRLDCAIISAKTLSASDAAVKKVEIRWNISVVWPNFWQSRALITGTSTLTVDTSGEEGAERILSQTDKLDMGGKEGTDVIKTISPQIQPRFWDLYHVGMTPSTENMTRMEPSNSNISSGAFSSYSLYEMPPRLVLQPSMEDDGGRAFRNAEALPNHAFTTTITTTGPKQQRYVPTSPIEVSISRSGDGKSMISWNIPLPPEFVSYYDELPLENGELEDGEECKYAYQSRRLAATLPYGGGAQDTEVSDIRKKLYEQVIKDGLKPKLAEDGRPQFFFLNNDAKACFTADGGLGMAVYEWRPDFTKPNEVGIELEF